MNLRWLKFFFIFKISKILKSLDFFVSIEILETFEILKTLFVPKNLAFFEIYEIAATNFDCNFLIHDLDLSIVKF